MRDGNRAIKRSLITAMMTCVALMVACGDEPFGPSLGSITIDLVATDPAPPPVTAEADSAAVFEAPSDSVSRNEDPTARDDEGRDEVLLDDVRPEEEAEDSPQPPARSPGGTALFDGVSVRVQGPTPKTMNLALEGSNWFGIVTGLQPGSYTVTVQGTTGGEVTYYGTRSGVTVTGGQNTTASVPWNSFQPTIGALAAQTLQASLNVSWGTVTGATGYQLQWADNAGFTSPQSSTVTGTSAVAGPVGSAGTHHVRVRAANADVSNGAWSDAASFEVLTDTTSSGNDQSDAPNLGFAPTVGKTGLNILPAGDADWFAVEACVLDTLIVDVIAQRLTPASGLNSFLEIKSADGQTDIVQNDDAVGTDSRIELELGESGLFNVVVSGMGNTVGYYELSIQVSPGPQNTGTLCIGSTDYIEVTPIGSSILAQGGTVSLNAQAYDIIGTPLTGKTFSWTSLNPAVATVDPASGMVTGLASGQAIIAAETDAVQGFAVISVAVPANAIANYWTSQASPIAQGVNVWGVAPNDIWGVGHAGALVHYDGSSWSQLTSPTSDSLYAVWGTSAGEVFAGGQNGTLLVSYDTTTWTPMASPTSETIWGIWGSGSDNVFAVGTGGTILRYDGSQWTLETSGTTEWLRDIWGTDSANVYAVGAAGTILRYDGTSWSPETGVPVASMLTGIWAIAPDDMYVTGVSGVILHYDGTWSQMSTPTTSNLRSIWGTTSSDITVAGGSGLVLQWDGASWDSIPTPTTELLFEVWAAPGGDVFVSGAAGTILRGYRGAQLAFGSVPSNVDVSTPFTVEVAILDAGGTVITNASSDVTLAFSNNPGSVLLQTTGSTPNLYRIDAATPAKTGPVVGSITTLINGMTYDQSTGSVLGWTRSGSELYSVDPVSGAMTLVGSGGGPNLKGLAFEQGGAQRLLGVGGTTLYDVNPATGGLTSLGTLPFVGTGLATDPTTGTIYAAGGSGGGPFGEYRSLYTVDPNAVTATFIEALPMNGVSGLAFQPDGTLFATIGSTSGSPSDVQFPNTLWTVNTTDARMTRHLGLNSAGGQTIASVPAHLSGTLTVAAANGVASFTGIAVDAPESGYTLVATVPGLTDAFSSALTVVPGVYTSGPAVAVDIIPKGASVTVGGTFDFIVDAYDASWNPVANPLGWSTLNGSVVSTNPNGTVTGQGVGQAAVSAQVDGIVDYALVTVTDPSATPLSVWSPMASPTTDDLYGVWGTGPGNAFAVGLGGTILRFDGTSWTAMASGTTQWLTDVWGTAPDDVFAVGEVGTILHYDGISWSPMTSGVTNLLYRVWGSAPDDVFAVGDLGTIVHWDGASWTTMTTPTTELLVGVWGTASDDVFAVGLTGTILHYNGIFWYTHTAPTTGAYYGLWGASPDNVFLVGFPGEIVRYDGASWTSMTSPTTAWLWSLWGTSATDLYAVGTNGTILQYDGANWTTMPNLDSSPLRGIWGTGSGDEFAVGHNGTIMRGSRGRGSLYMISDVSDMLQTLDPTSLAIADLGPLGVGYEFGDCAWNPADGALYMVDGRPTSPPNTLYEVNVTTGAATAIGVHGVTDMFGIGYHPPTDAVYGSAGGNLYRLDLGTGAATLIGPTGFGTFEGLAWDWLRNQFVGLTAGSASLYDVDVSTGTSTLIASAGGFNDLGLTYDPVIDRFWVVDYSGEVAQIDPTAGYARTDLTSGTGSHTCIAYIP